MTGAISTAVSLRDPGAMRRAVEHGLAGLGPGLGPLSLTWETLPATDYEQLARCLQKAAPVVARLRSASGPELLQLARSGAVSVAQRGSNWVVIRPDGLLVVNSHGEERLRLSLSAVSTAVGVQGDAEETFVICLEPRLALQSLSAEALGSKSPWARLRALLALDSRDLLALVLYALVLGGLSLALPVAVQVLVNSIAFGSLLQPLVVLTALLLGGLALSGLVQVVEVYAVEVLQRRVFVRIAEDFSRRLSNVTPYARAHYNIRELSNRFFEVVTLQKTLGKLLVDGLGLALQTVAGMLLLAFYHPLLLVFDVALAGALLGIFLLGYGAVSTAVDESNAKYKVAKWLQTIAASPEEFAQENGARFAAQRTDALTRDYLRLRRRHYAQLFRQLICGVTLRAFALVSLLGLGGWLVIQRQLTLGQLVAAELVVGSIGVGFAKLGKLLESVYDMLASVDKVGKVVDLPQGALRSRMHLSDSAMTLQFRALQVHSQQALPLEEEIAPGSRVLIDSTNESLRQALVSVLAGQAAPLAGHVVGLSDQGEVWRGSRLLDSCCVLEHQRLIEGTVLDNLKLACPELSESAAWDALNAVALADPIHALKDGLQQHINPTESCLSPAESTRLLLARLRLAPPSVVITDGSHGPLASDPEELALLAQALGGPNPPWTVLIACEFSALHPYANRCIRLHAVSSTAQQPPHPTAEEHTTTQAQEKA